MPIKTITPEWRGGRWQVKITRPDGTRPWVNVGDGSLKEKDRELATTLANRLLVAMRASGDGRTDGDETLGQWAKRWNEARKGKISAASARNDARDFRIHIGPELGHLPMRSITTECLTDFVRHLDKCVEAGDYSAKTATNIWSCVRAMFRDASTNKDRSLRILDTNPCATVPPPDADLDGEKQKQMLYPDEFVKLLSCEDVPLARRRLYAFAVLTQTRQAEIRALTFVDVDLDHRRIDINKSTNVLEGTKATKSGRVRDVTIELTLVPLLEAMRDESSPRAKLFPSMPRVDGDVGLASLFRRDLKTAGVHRAVLHEPTSTSMVIRFHDLRASGISWRLARGDNPLVVRQETGHADAEVQQIYVRKLRDLFGAELFPTLPKSLFEERPGSAQTPKKYIRNPAKIVGAVGFEEAADSRESPVKIAKRREVTDQGAPKRDTSAGLAENLSAALRKAADAGQWDIVSELSRQLADLRREGFPVLRAVPQKTKAPTTKR